MKIEQLRNIIKEEVRSAIKEELQEILTEAVKIASEPHSNKAEKTEKVLEGIRTQPPHTGAGSKSTTIDELLNRTAQTMTSEEYRNIFAGTSDIVQKPMFNSNTSNTAEIQTTSAPAVGIDIAQLDFVAKAKSVFDLSKKKDKLRTN